MKNKISNIKGFFNSKQDYHSQKATSDGKASEEKLKAEGQQVEKNRVKLEQNLTSVTKEKQYAPIKEDGGIRERDDIEKLLTHEIFVPLQKKKLIIILLENTKVMNEQLTMVSKIINSIRMSELVCIINYGSVVTISDIIDASDLNKFPILNTYDIGEKAHFYDAILRLEKLVSQKYLSIEVRKGKRLMIDSIEIIGIGTCKDNGSMHLKETAQNSFYQVVSKPKITTKYFCLTEGNMVSAAEMGFRSIGAILRSF